MNTQTVHEASGSPRFTTKRREFWGWFGSMAWMLLLNYGYQMFMLDWESPAGSWYPFFFMVLVALSMIACGAIFGRNPDGLARIAAYTTPMAIAITAVFSFLPSTLGSVLYVISPIFMAPAITRRVYGILRTSETSFQLMRYIVSFAACIAVVTTLNFIRVPKEVVFIGTALLAIPAWIGIRRSASLPEPPPDGARPKPSRHLAVLLTVAMLALFWLNIMHIAIHMLVIAPAGSQADILLTLLGFILPPLAFLLYAFIGDKGYERIGFICGMALFLIGIQLTFLPSAAFGTRLLLTLAEGLGGTYTQFFILTFPVYFLAGARRPVFAASLGVALTQLLSALYWKVGAWLPGIFREMGAPVLVSAAISTVVFIVLVFILFERQKEKSLAAALYALLHTGADDVSPAAGGMPKESEPHDKTENLFSEEERDIVFLLIDSETKREISRKLHLDAAEVSRRISSIREKVGAAAGLDPVNAAISKSCRLTRRETDMLGCLRQSMTNTEIASELFLSEETVKIHVRNLMNKLPVENRHDIVAWAQTFEIK